jgi:hypothetical protein
MEPSKSLQRFNRFVGYAATILMVAVAGLAFLVSFETIREFAQRSGAVKETLAWAIPPLVDSPIVMASLVWLNRSLNAEKAWFAKFVITLAAGASLALNMAHAPHNLGAWSVAMIAPVALVLSVELAMSELRRAVKRRQVVFAQVPGGGAPPALPAGDIDLSILLESISEASDSGSLSGKTLSEALGKRGVEITPRDARRLLAVMRPKDEEEAKPSAEDAETKAIEEAERVLREAN